MLSGSAHASQSRQTARQQLTRALDWQVKDRGIQKLAVNGAIKEYSQKIVTFYLFLL